MESMGIRKKRPSYLVLYDCKKEVFRYPEELTELFGLQFDDRPLWQILLDAEIIAEGSARHFQEKIIEISQASQPRVLFVEYYIKSKEQIWKWYRLGFVCPVPGEAIHITITDIEEEINDKNQFFRNVEYDNLTGLYNRTGFCKRADNILTLDEQGVKSGKYALVCFDVLRFKAINDLFGDLAGNRLLKHIADVAGRMFKQEDLLSRPNADHYLILTTIQGKELEDTIEQMLNAIADFDLPFEINCNVGIYIANEPGIKIDSMIDRAVLAQASVKGSYTKRYNYYTEQMRNEMLGEQEITGMMATALSDKHFVVYYQPQYNHTTGMLIGAEALVRWQHPEKGLISPGVFIPIFEKTGFITKLDLYVFEQTCIFVRKCMDSGYAVVPVSTNFSRHDIYQPDFVESLEKIREKYNIPSKYLRVEITESAVIGSVKYVNEVIEKLHRHGYLVEMDDFGSGYSSLNVLKDIELDVIKLDMLFLEDERENNRGGTIVSAVVRMAKWLDVPVIAEGVETIEQADFLRSIGCDYIQGYLYSKPLPQEEYEKLISKSAVGATVPQMKLIDTLNACDFWDPNSRETLIFSNYVGGAAIFEYRAGDVEILRVNKKYLDEICMNLSEKDLIESDPWAFFDEENRAVYEDMLRRAIETGEEQECETWRNVSSECCGADYICLRANVRMVGKSDDSYLFYAMIRNITTEKNRYAELMDRERRFNAASEQASIYYWEYTVATREMRPCFRCMRDLGLPALLTNYPDSAIERGVFPPEIADMYRDWHKQIAEGVEELEAVMPLTMNRVMHKVKYTTEFDENGRPLKAYGSATPV